MRISSRRRRRRSAFVITPGDRTLNQIAEETGRQQARVRKPQHSSYLEVKHEYHKRRGMLGVRLVQKKPYRKLLVISLSVSLLWGEELFPFWRLRLLLPLPATCLHDVNSLINIVIPFGPLQMLSRLHTYLQFVPVLFCCPQSYVQEAAAATLMSAHK